MSNKQNNEMDDKEIGSIIDSVKHEEPQTPSTDVDLKIKDSSEAGAEEINESGSSLPEETELQSDDTMDSTITNTPSEDVSESVDNSDAVKVAAAAPQAEDAVDTSTNKAFPETETEAEKEPKPEPVPDQTENTEPQTSPPVSVGDESTSEATVLTTEPEIYLEENTDTDIPSESSKSKQVLFSILCILLTLIIIAGASFAVNNYYSVKPAIKTEETTQTFNNTDVLSTLTPNQNKVEYPEGILEKYKAIYSLNPDVIGWLKMPNTSIDTVIVQGKDNSLYLKTDFYGIRTYENRYGNAFLDYRDEKTELSQNSIIYGHTTETPRQQVFCDLNKYEDYKFFIKNPIIEYDTLYADYEWKVFATFVSSTNKGDDNGYFFYYIPTEISASKFSGFLDQINQRSLYFTGVDVNENDKILTLSTCSYLNNFSGRVVDTRLVVVARLLREGESKEIDVSKVKDNPNYRRPQVWYNHFGLKNPYANSENWHP